jgi:hypothetical protein
MNRSLVALAVLCSALAGCEGIGDPEDLVASYTLDVDPAVVYVQDQVRVQVMEDRFWLREDGTADREIVERIDYPSPGPRDTTITRDEEYRYETDASMDVSAIELTAVCDPRALCVPGPHLWGQMTREGMELRWLRDPDVLLSYRRLDR